MLLLITVFLSFLATAAPRGVAAEGFFTGSKTMEITDFSIVSKGIVNGNYIQSDTFTVGGYQWAIEFYPQGYNSESSAFVSIIARLLNPKNVVKAIYNHRLQDWNTSSWSTNTPVVTDVQTFSPNGYTGWGDFRFIRRSDLESSSYLRNDTLVVKTTLWVAKGTPSTSLDSELVPQATMAGDLHDLQTA